MVCLPIEWGLPLTLLFPVLARRRTTGGKTALWVNRWISLAKFEVQPVTSPAQDSSCGSFSSLIRGL